MGWREPACYRHGPPFDVYFKSPSAERRSAVKKKPVKKPKVKKPKKPGKSKFGY